MRVLAVDPGYGRCGVAVLERTDGKDILVYSECIETSPSAEFAMRLGEIVSRIESALGAHKPDCVALEKLYFSTNQKTGLRVAEVRGAIIACAAGAGLSVSEYGPSEVKSALGYGKADKRQVASMLRMLVKIEKDIRLDDEYDAIAVGVTHLAHAASYLARKNRVAG